MIGVVHLVWGPLGPEPLRRFLHSYSEHPAGADHELVVLLNGVEGSAAEQRRELEGFEHRVLELPEPVQDLTAYAHAAARLEHERLCFLNSYSELLADGWLAKLAAGLAPAGVGAAAATGSWASLRSLALNGLGLPNAYRGALPSRRQVFAGMDQMQRELQRRRADPEPATAPPHLRGAFATARATLEQVVRFPPFPDPHLRTNGFICDRELFAFLDLVGAHRKIEAYELESGRRGITRQLRSLGLDAVVVDRHGAGYSADRWPQSRTFWQGDQEGLLVADNQTGAYDAGDAERRRLLAGLAWGRQAQPGSGRSSSATLVPAPPDR